MKTMWSGHFTGYMGFPVFIPLKQVCEDNTIMWHIRLCNWVVLGVNIGKYSSTIIWDVRWDPSEIDTTRSPIWIGSLYCANDRTNWASRQKCVWDENIKIIHKWYQLRMIQWRYITTHIVQLTGMTVKSVEICAWIFAKLGGAAMALHQFSLWL